MVLPKDMKYKKQGIKMVIWVKFDKTLKGIL